MSFRWHHPAVSAVTATTAIELTAMTDSYNNSSNSIKGSKFLLLAKKKKQQQQQQPQQQQLLRKSLVLPKTFPYLLIFPSTNSNLITYLALYKGDQATHNSPHHYTLSIPFSLSYSETSFTLLPMNIYSSPSPSLLQNLFS